MKHAHTCGRFGKDVASWRHPVDRRRPDAYSPQMDKSTLMPIGRFAKLTDLSQRLLRRLDERGLLSPVYVDPDTRYRYYDLSQTRTAGLVHLCRQLDLPTDEIAEVVAARAHGDLHAQLERHRDRLALRLAEQTRLLRLLEQELERGELLMTYEIALKEVPATLVVSALGSMPRAHPHDPWSLESALRRAGSTVLGHIARQGERPVAHPIVLYDTDFARDDEISFEVCFPVARRLPPGPGIACRELPEELVAFTTFTGAYDTIWNAYVELHAWIVENGYVASGPVREVGVVTDLDTDDARQWVTELAVPLAT
jgi:DNA-binding transcriptional MerR regulator/effector-binding domain-containing protein